MAGSIDATQEYAEITAYFQLDIDGAIISCQEISGLAQELEVCTFRNGDRADGFISKRSGLPKVGEITIKRGVFNSHSDFEDLMNKWHNDRAYSSNQGERFDMSVMLLDQDEAVVVQWNCVACWPSKYEGPTLKGDESAIAFETCVMQVEEIHTEYQ